MRKLVGLIFLLFFGFCAVAQNNPASKSKKEGLVCNPLNLNYRFQPSNPSRREAADPTVVVFKGEYYLFASKSGGYWYSSDLASWTYVKTDSYEVENYAPTVIVINDTLYLLGSKKAKQNIYKTHDPKSGNWEIAYKDFPIVVWDPCLFMDENNRLYLYWGCDDVTPISAIELNSKTFEPIGKPVVCFNSSTETLGWERYGEYNQSTRRPWIEGAWMNKYNGKYYLQYASPGTEFRSYNDAVYVSNNPLGPFEIAKHNPFSYKPGGFATGAGHGSTFKDNYGNYWHVGTMTISVKHMFERRLCLFPTYFDKDSILYAMSRFGDYPIIIPNKKVDCPDQLFTGWMNLAVNKPVFASSELSGYPKENAVNEDIRTYWSASTGKKGEWLTVDLGSNCKVNAIQINFGEQNTTLLDNIVPIFNQYIIESSWDNIHWSMLIDKSLNEKDLPHDFVQLAKPIQARYVRITNVKVSDGNFAIRGLRVFGKSKGKKPKAVKNFEVKRLNVDSCVVNLKWSKVKRSAGYNIRYGNDAQKLYHTYQVTDIDSLTIRSLNSKSKYFFTIEPFNECGVGKISQVVSTF